MCWRGQRAKGGYITGNSSEKKIVSIMIKLRLMFIAFKSPNEWRSLGNAWLFPSLQFLFFLVVIFGAEVYASVELFRFYDEVRNHINYTDL